MTEADLISRIKTAQDSEALTTLANQHTGIYTKVVDQYASAYPHTIRRDDLLDDRLTNLWNFISDYEPSRGTKLGTYIGNRTDWMCKTLLKQEKRNPVRAGTYGPSGAHSLGTVGDTYVTEQGASITLADETADADVAAMADKDLKLEEVMAAAYAICEDKRFITILGHRHFNTSANGQTSLSWRQIGEKMDLSHERVRVIYNQNMTIVRAHLRDRAV